MRLNCVREHFSKILNYIRHNPNDGFIKIAAAHKMHSIATHNWIQLENVKLIIYFVEIIFFRDRPAATVRYAKSSIILFVGCENLLNRIESCSNKLVYISIVHRAVCIVHARIRKIQMKL